MEIVILWLVLSFVVAYLGKDRKIGYGGTLIISLLFSPLLGIVFALASQRVPVSKGKTLTHEATVLYKEGVRYFNNKKYGEAIKPLNEALNHNPKSKTIFIKLAQCYSMREDNTTSLYYIHKAVENGYSNFTFILSERSFRYVRQQNGFKKFVDNGYKLVPDQYSELNGQFEKTDKDSGSNDKYDQLEKLASLRKRQIITKEEFEIEKQKLLT